MPTSLVTAVLRGDTLKAGTCVVVPWWSVTKTVLSAAALVLVAQGRLQLDEPVRGRAFTLRQLLQHRAGLGDYGGLAAYHASVAASEEPWPVAELLRRVDPARLLFKPGQGWSYSNIGYLLVRRLIEQATDTPVDVALDALVLAPLEITGTRIANRPADLDATAWGNEGRYHPGWVYHGLLIGPAGDAALFLHRLLDGHLLPAPLLDAMRAPLPIDAPLAGRPWISVGSGLGLTDCRTASGRFIGHTGSGPGSMSAVYRHVPEDGGDHPAGTAAVFAPSGALGTVEENAVALASGATT